MISSLLVVSSILVRVSSGLRVVTGGCCSTGSRVVGTSGSSSTRSAFSSSRAEEAVIRCRLNTFSLLLPRWAPIFLWVSLMILTFRLRIFSLDVVGFWEVCVEVVAVVALLLASVTLKAEVVDSPGKTVPLPLGASRPRPLDVLRNEGKVDFSSWRVGSVVVVEDAVGTRWRVLSDVTVCAITALESCSVCCVDPIVASVMVGLARTGEKTRPDCWGTAGTGRRKGLLLRWLRTGRWGTAGIGSGRIFWTGASRALATGWSSTVPRKTSTSSWWNLFSMERNRSLCWRNLSSVDWGRNLCGSRWNLVSSGRLFTMTVSDDPVSGSSPWKSCLREKGYLIEAYEEGVGGEGRDWMNEVGRLYGLTGSDCLADRTFSTWTLRRSCREAPRLRNGFGVLKNTSLKMWTSIFIKGPSSKFSYIKLPQNTSVNLWTNILSEVPSQYHKNAPSQYGNQGNSITFSYIYHFKNRE